MIAKLIGERSAGMTAVEIYDGNDNLVWSHEWFTDGCTGAGYVTGLCEAVDCMFDCEDWAHFDGGDVDDDGRPIAKDTEPTTGVIVSYDTASGWTIDDAARSYGQGYEILDALMVAGLIEADNYLDSCVDDVITIADHIKSREAG